MLNYSDNIEFKIALIGEPEVGISSLIKLATGKSFEDEPDLTKKYYKETGSYKNVIIYRLYLVSICFLFISIVFILAKDSIIRFTGSFSNYLLAYIFFLGLVLNDFVSQILYPGDKNKLQAGIMFFNNIIILKRKR